jgi:hypothetical protein
LQEQQAAQGKKLDKERRRKEQLDIALEVDCNL